MTWATIGDNMGGAQDSTEESAKDKDGRIMAGPGETDPMTASNKVPGVWANGAHGGVIHRGGTASAVGNTSSKRAVVRGADGRDDEQIEGESDGKLTRVREGEERDRGGTRL
jgi:hypothetical protein